MASESELTSRLLARWRKRHPEGVAWKMNDRVAHSRPDAVLFFNGCSFVIEFKRGTNVVSDGQREELRRLWRSGCSVYLCRFLDGGEIRILRMIEDSCGGEWQDEGTVTAEGFCEFFS